MKREPKRCRWCLSLAVVLLCLPLSGCNLLVDEFTWLDRGPPPNVDPADAFAQ